MINAEIKLVFGEIVVVSLSVNCKRLQIEGKNVEYKRVIRIICTFSIYILFKLVSQIDRYHKQIVMRPLLLLQSENQLNSQVCHLMYANQWVYQ